MLIFSDSVFETVSRIIFNKKSNILVTQGSRMQSKTEIKKVIVGKPKRENKPTKQTNKASFKVFIIAAFWQTEKSTEVLYRDYADFLKMQLRGKFKLSRNCIK